MAVARQAEMVELGGLVLVVVFILAPCGTTTQKRRTLLKKDGNIRPVFWVDVKARTEIL